MFAQDIPQTIAEAYREIREGGDPWVAIGDFSHDWYGNYPTPEQRRALVAEPVEMPTREQPGATPEQQIQLRQWAVFCAASVEYLCVQAGLDIPSWVDDPRYILPEEEAFYTSPAASQKPAVRERLHRQSPEPFRRRNIYCSDRIYANKYTAAPIRRRSA